MVQREFNPNGPPLLQLLLSFLLAVALIVPSPHASTERHVAGWQIESLPAGGGCLASRSFAGDGALRLRLDATGGTAALHLVTPGWGPLIEGDAYAFAYDLDGVVAEAEGTGRYLETRPGVLMAIGSADLVDQLAGSEMLRVYFGESEIVTAQLSGGAEAVEAARLCLARQGG